MISYEIFLIKVIYEIRQSKLRESIITAKTGRILL